MQQVTIEHHIQKDILRRLASSDGLRFSDLKSGGLESNIFMYHLTLLRKKGLLEKTKDKYRLTTDGMAYVDRLSFVTLRPRLQPKIISIVVVRNKDGDIAVLKRLSQPYIGSYMLPSGKLHFGESLNTHAARELTEKTGLTVPMQKRGVASITITRDDQIMTHVIATVWSGELGTSSPVACSDPRFECIWISEADLAAQAHWPGTLEILELLAEKQPFITELNF